MVPSEDKGITHVTWILKVISCFKLLSLTGIIWQLPPWPCSIPQHPNKTWLALSFNFHCEPLTEDKSVREWWTSVKVCVETAVHMARGVRWNFGNQFFKSSWALCNSIFCPHHSDSPSFFFSSLLWLLFLNGKEKWEHSFHFLIQKSSLVSNPNPGTQLGSSLAHKQEFRIQRPSHRPWEWKEFAGRDGQGWGQRKCFYFILRLICILLLEKKLMMNRIDPGEFDWSW